MGATALLIGMATAYSSEAVNVRYSWKLKGEYAAFYVAKEQGLFRKHGLDVSLGEGAGASAALGGLLQDKEDVVVLPAAFALTAISKGMPIRIVALYHPKTPLGILSFSDKPVRKPSDLEGKSFIVAPGDTVATYLPAFCKINNVDCEKISKVSVGIEARNSQFLSRNVDVIGTYLNVDAPLLEQQAKQSLVILNLSENGLILPGLSVVTSEAKLTREPEKISRFLAALNEGMGVIKDNPRAATMELLKNWAAPPSYEIVEKQVIETAHAIPQMAGKPLGWIDPASLQRALDLLREVGEIQAVKPLDRYYTNSLLAQPQ
ncbi:ABC transporter substrate-binding protein [Bradyrhizobium jicamae]|uniref:ABC transporter substrate-binding protein n=1 Tax=Bradyrhizobium jicamae TaxID=280332 RepID=UPI0020120716|nr:ABC transporter substrate-binding protein [Bradyrhizobium jicamae]